MLQKQASMQITQAINLSFVNKNVGTDKMNNQPQKFNFRIIFEKHQLDTKMHTTQ